MGRGNKRGNEGCHTMILRQPRYERTPHLDDVRRKVLDHVAIALAGIVDRDPHPFAAHELEHPDGRIGGEPTCGHLGDEVFRTAGDFQRVLEKTPKPRVPEVDRR